MNFSSASGILLALWWVFTVCFIVFPGTFYDSYFDMLSGISDEDTRTGWYDIAIILQFNIFDTIGRWLGGKIHITGKAVMIGSYMRTIFVASCIMIALKSEPQFLFDHDWFKILNMMLFGITNGYIGT